MIRAGAALAIAFAAAMDRLGPFESRPALAVAVSGGADSMALAVLARDWVRPRHGSVLALVVDHGLRPASALEARITVERLAALGVPARLLPLSDLRHGPSLAERARTMRYQALTESCRNADVLHLLLGHHAADQVETLAMRVLRGSQAHGLAGMSALRETPDVRLLRPLLGMDPALLRCILTASCIEWIEDPSNHDRRATRSRLRHRLAVHAQTQTGLPQAIAAAGKNRSQDEADVAAELSRRVTIRPEGFALLSAGRISSAAMARLVRTISGMPYPASVLQISELAAEPRPATVAGVRIMPAGRLGAGFLIVREEAAIMEPVEARPNTIWDNRFRLTGHSQMDRGGHVGKLGSDAAKLRRGSDLPSAVLRTLPALRVGKVLVAVPHLGYVSHAKDSRLTVLFTPRERIAGACFVPAG